MKKTTFLLLILPLFVLARPPKTSNFIRIDQFGYRPDASKVAVIVSPQVGFDKDATFKPTTDVEKYELRRWSDDAVILKGTLRAYSGGVTDPISGDKAWWFDFSSVKTSGSYYVYDVGNQVGSFRFEISENVYNNVLRSALKMFYYNRCNTEKKLEHAGANWTDKASFVGRQQDTEARSVTDQSNVSTAKDLSGGWWDAGDYNKYVTFTRTVIFDLLAAYDQNPKAWGDDLNIPESKNGIPDIIDEIKWEIDWLKKMQLADGSSLIKMGCLVNTDGQATLPPSTDPRPRFYYPKPCTSATICLASVFARTAYTFRQFPQLKEYADDLQKRAISAFNAYQNTSPKETNCDNGSIQAGDADWDEQKQEKTKVQAAIYLFALTGSSNYHDVFINDYKKIDESSWWGYYNTDFLEALLFYTTLPNKNTTIANALTTSKQNAGNQDFYRFIEDKDPYRAFMRTESFHWGHLNPRAQAINVNADMLFYKLDLPNHDSYRKRIEEMIHYFHGVNPLNMVYLSNMYEFGAENSVNEVYHAWFKDKSDWDNAKTSKYGPAPGYVPGGPNKSYAPGQGNCILSPPCAQPPAKSYLDWNGVWPDASWAVTEPAIYYQSAYLKALSKLVTNAEISVLPKQEPEVVLATESRETIELMKVMPNPSHDSIVVKVVSKQNIQTTLSMINVSGKAVLNKIVDLNVGENDLKLNVSNLSSGVYLIQVNGLGLRFLKE
jgi:endoglucanase